MIQINNIFIGGWFQRTMLQLSEIYDFLRNHDSKINLDKSVLDKYRKDLQIGKIDYGIEGEEYIIFTTALGITVKIFEDGLIVLNTKQVSEDTLFTDLDNLTDYYENKLSSAINYLFSLGAPVPKELANIENVYPYFIVCNKATPDEMSSLLSRTEGQKYFEFNNDKYSVMRGDKYYFINMKNQSMDNISRYVEEQIFIREFKGQLHRYLNLHRIIWEKIDDVKANSKVKGKDIVKFTTKLEGYAKTITLIDGRIKQMGSYIDTREKIARSDNDLEEFLLISGYRYETLTNTLSYIKSLWDMTKSYVASAQKMFDGIKQDVTSSSVNSLTIVTSMSAGAAIIDLFTESKPTFTSFGVVYFFVLAIIGWSSTKILAYISSKRKYDVTDIDFEKNIE